MNSHWNFFYNPCECTANLFITTIFGRCYYQSCSLCICGRRVFRLSRWRIRRRICRCRRTNILSLPWWRRMVDLLLYYLQSTLPRHLQGDTHLFLFLFWHRGWIGQLCNLLPFFPFFEALANWCKQAHKGICHGALQVLRVNLAFLKRFPEGIIRGEVHGAAILLVP